MLVTKTLAIALLSAFCASAFPDMNAFARDLEDEIYAKHMAKMGLTRREDHPDPQMVQREVRDIVARNTPLIMRVPTYECSTLLPYCSYNSECQIKSGECSGCGRDTHKCQRDRDYSPSPEPVPQDSKNRHPKSGAKSPSSKSGGHK
jgi:hypothetical protein